MGLSTQQFYDRFSFFYPLVDLFLKKQKKVLFAEINKLPSGKILEIGVGNGAHLKFYGKHNITGIDSSAGMLNQARKNNAAGVTLLEMDGGDLQFEQNAFYYVVLSHVLAVVKQPDILLKEVHRVLRPGGKLFILNHFTPVNWLKYIDRIFGLFSNLFHFRSVFYLEDIMAIKLFKLIKEIRFPPSSYFKLLVYQKG